MPTLHKSAFVSFLLAALCQAGRAAEPAPDFAREVRPILAQFCFKCHGPDDATRKAKLRLDERASALAKGAIKPGKPAESELVARVFLPDDDKARMPPLATRTALTPSQKQTLERWVASGAEYRPHWAFGRPTRPHVPPLGAERKTRNPIDAFVLAGLKKAGLSPSPEADRYTLLRRVSLDLVGLPPTPEEADAFARDSSPDAYEKVVDRLLSSPHYGERWARRWLDLARYADTNGYEKDRPRSIWPYRDWVIRSLNADLPFDRFTIEQLAGDLLQGSSPAEQLQRRVATGFHRNTMLNEEGGIDPLEFRYHAVADRVATTGAAWLGLTLDCAQCHTHKFDPISHKEYYQLFAFLNNADEPEVAVPSADLVARRTLVEEKVRAALAGLPGRFPKGTDPEKAFTDWLAAGRRKVSPWRVLRPTEAKANLPLLTVQPDDSVFASGDFSKRDVYSLTFRADLEGVTALRLEVLPDERLPRGGPGRVYYEGPHGDFHLSTLTASADGKPARLVRASHSFAAGGFPAANALDENPQTGWGINGGQGRRHVAVFGFEKPVSARELDLKMVFERYYAAGLGRFRISVTSAKEPTATDLPAEVEALLLVPEEKWTKAQRALLREQFHLTTLLLAGARKEIDALRQELPGAPTTLVMQERPAENPRVTHVHHRGEFLQSREVVEPGTPAFLPPLPVGAPRNRLGFARWLVSPENPLTARVAVNRQWAAFFGRGVVRTTEDFGYQGELPAQPELLDWLAVEFMEGGWSLKKLHRLIVTSATYRQASQLTPELRARDPENVLLARGPRQRLEAELLRDSVLWASGLLSEKMGGPSVFPPQPASVTTEGTYGALPWKASTGEDRYRRGLYTFAKRTAPFAMLATFDGPSGEACVARRDVSNTPLQALTLLNDVAFTEATQETGRKMAGRAGSTQERVKALFRRFLIRSPGEEEVSLLSEFVSRQKQKFAAAPLEARKLAGEGPGDVAERAAWAALARVLMNLDEFVTKN